MAMLLCRLSPGCSGGRPRAYTERVLFQCEARSRLSFVKSCVWVTGARENQPTGPRTRAGQSWRAVFFTRRPLLSHRGRSLRTRLGTQPQSLWSCAAPPAEMNLGLACELPPFFLHGEHAACGCGAGPRDSVGGGYRDNLSQACGEQPLGCRLFPFVNLVLKARPSLQPHGVHCCHAPGSCCSLHWPPAPGKQGPRAGTQLFLATLCAQYEERARPPQLCKSLVAEYESCNRRWPFSLGIPRSRHPPPT